MGLQVKGSQFLRGGAFLPCITSKPVPQTPYMGWQVQGSGCDHRGILPSSQHLKKAAPKALLMVLQVQDSEMSHRGKHLLHEACQSPSSKSRGNRVQNPQRVPKIRWPLGGSRTVEQRPLPLMLGTSVSEAGRGVAALLIVNLLRRLSSKS